MCDANDDDRLSTAGVEAAPDPRAIPRDPPSLKPVAGRILAPEPPPIPPAAREPSPPAVQAPTLPAERDRRRFGRHARRLKLTREGRYYLGITIGVGFAAINTGNNLLYLMLGMLLSLIVVSGVMSELSLRELTVRRKLPPRAQVGRPHLVEIEVFNHKRHMPSYAIEVEDLRAGLPADKRCFFLKISPNSAQVAAYRRTPARRGRDRHTGFRLATRFPFGLFEKSRELEAPDELVIYPAVDPVRLGPNHGDKPGQHGRAAARGGGDEIHTIRPMREGDDPRDIYWRKSASLGQRVLRERVEDTRPEVDLVLEVARPAPPPADFTSAFEQRVREIASRAVAHVKRGDRVVVRTTAGQRVVVSQSVGADPVLRMLALVEPIEAPARGGRA